ncbi:MAG: hypothetical protein GXO75_00235, partial [Calditrichaeota bacterium]|nr:hypothetical protein [Calditrichota bacterium]
VDYRVNVPVGKLIGGLIIYDGLKEQEYSDLKNSGRVTFSNVSKTDSLITLTVGKKYPGADFNTKITYSLFPDHLRWDVYLEKTKGADRTMRITYVTPLLIQDWKLWAPVARTPFTVHPDEPFLIKYGQSYGGPVGSMTWRSVIPTVTFFDEKGGRAVNFTVPFEVPQIMVRFTSNIDRNHFYHFNSRKYSLEQRPHFFVINDYLGLRDHRNAHASLLISSHRANWRESLGWVYHKYREYFDASPAFAKSDGVWMNGYEVLHLTPENEMSARLSEAQKNGVKWEELHGHFPHYGLMVPDDSVSTWKFEGKGMDLSRQIIRRTLQRFHDYGIRNYIYYNITEAIHGYATDKFPHSIARDEDGKPILAFRGAKYPQEVNSCFLMNADPATAFGKHCVQQLKKMVQTYPQMDGIFYDVFGRTYCFDFAHDDGITMVNNKPAYFPIFMFQKNMEIISPYLHAQGKCITCNKPTMIQVCKGVDGIMMRESNPKDADPPWLIAQSYLGLNRHILIATSSIGKDQESLYQNCLRFGAFYTDISKRRPIHGKPPDPEGIKISETLRSAYGHFIKDFKGKKWVFYPRALELPVFTRGNIFKLADGRVMITMISPGRSMFEDGGFKKNLQIKVHLPNMRRLKKAVLSSPDYDNDYNLKLNFQGKDGLILDIPEHRTASIVYLIF